MKKIVLVTSDTGLSAEMGGWIKELGEDIVLEVLTELTEFDSRYLFTPEKDPDANDGGDVSVTPPEPPLTSEQDALQAEARRTAALDSLGELAHIKTPINILVVDLDLVPDDPVGWLTTTKQILINHGYSSDGPEQTRCIFIGHNSPDFDINLFRHAAVDDLLLKPPDKSLFLQKGEVLLKRGESSAGSFLFTQRTELVVEMGKDGWIEGLSDYGFTIRNPSPLATGVFATIHCEIFGEGHQDEIIGRVHRVERHPAREGEFLCHFSFHGIAQSQLMRLRKHMLEERKHVRRPSGNAWPIIRMPPKTIAVIDMNTEVRGRIREAIEGNFQNIAIKEFPSYTSFLRYCSSGSSSGGANVSGASHLHVAEASSEETASTAVTTTPRSSHASGGSLCGATEVSILVNTANFELVSFEPPPKDGARFVGIEATQIQSRPVGWIDGFDGEGKEGLKELLVYLRTGREGEIGVAGFPAGPAGPAAYFRVGGRIERAGESDGVSVARLTFQEQSEDAWREAWARPSAEGAAEAVQIEAIYIDGGFLGDSPAGAIEGLIATLESARLIHDREALFITVLGDERSSLRPRDFRLKHVRDFLSKPLDRKMLVQKAALLLPGMIPKRDDLDLSSCHAGAKCLITKEVVMEELSESGLQIRHETPLREGTFLHFVSPDLLGPGVLGRCLASKSKPDSDSYQCFFSFFAITDTQLKHIRSWIREDYAAKKEKAAG